MMPDRTKWLLYARNFILTAFAAAFILSCANIARPTGGPIDTTPPVFVKSNPKPNQLNFNKNKIEIEFDEIIQVDKPTEKVIVSPAQKNMPQIQTSGRKVIVELQDSLIPNTTYTIDFSDAISDNNERNPLYNFSFSFATGNSIDTLQIGGILLNAENLEPVTGMLVGLHSNLNDSAFTKTPMQRIAKSDAYGRFSIKNIGAGTYRIYGLNDANRDYKFDNPSEDIAFMDSTVTPTVEMVMHADTIWADSTTIDTIKMVALPHFYPNDIILKVFNEQFKSRYLEKFERTNRNRFSLIFSAPDDSLPVLTPLNFQQEDWAIVEKNQTNDTLLYWIKDSLIYNMDTLLFTADYKRTDSLRQLTPFKDTLNLVFRERKKPVRKSKKDKKDDDQAPEIEFMKISPQFSSIVNIYDKLNFAFDQPVDSIKEESLKLEIKVDTVWTPVNDYTFFQDSLKHRIFSLKTKWKPGGEYRVSLDSLASVSIYGNPSNRLSQSFKVKTVEEYSNFYIETLGIKDSAFVELLNSSDQPVRKSPVKDGGAEFIYVDPGTYYIRLVKDRNGNGKFDTGNFAEKRQPEEVFYYPTSIDLKANWDVEQTWDVYALPLDKQKPLDITKNKPKDEKKDDSQNNNKEEGPVYSNRPSGAITPRSQGSYR